MDQASGFKPWQVSAIVNQAVLDQHAEEAPFLWQLRRSAVREAHHDLDSLTRLDDRVEGHLQGLRVDTAAGWRTALQRMEAMGSGVLFTLGALAFGGDSRERLAHVLHLAAALPEAQGALMAAMAWAPTASVLPWARMLLHAHHAPYRELAVGALACHRLATSHDLHAALMDADPGVRARALRAVGQCALHDMVGTLKPVLAEGPHAGAHHHANSKPDASLAEAPRFWAAWSLALMGHAEGSEALLGIVRHTGPFAWQAMQLVLRAVPLAQGREVVRELVAQSGRERIAIAAAGVLGDPQALPWLLMQMEKPDFARLAGEALSMITGIDLADEDLATSEPPQAQARDEDDAAPDAAAPKPDSEPADHEDTLPWPDVAKLQAYFAQHQQAWMAGQRLLRGQPLSAAHCMEVLRRGRQRQRSAAALELALLTPGRPLFDTQARGRLQKRRLAQWSS